MDLIEPTKLHQTQDLMDPNDISDKYVQDKGNYNTAQAPQSETLDGKRDPLNQTNRRGKLTKQSYLSEKPYGQSKKNNSSNRELPTGGSVDRIRSQTSLEAIENELDKIGNDLLLSLKDRLTQLKQSNLENNRVLFDQFHDQHQQSVQVQQYLDGINAAIEAKRQKLAVEEATNAQSQQKNKQFGASQSVVNLKIKAPYESEEMQKINSMKQISTDQKVASIQQISSVQKISYQRSRGSSFSNIKQLLESKHAIGEEDLEQNEEQENYVESHKEPNKGRRNLSAFLKNNGDINQFLADQNNDDSGKLFEGSPRRVIQGKASDDPATQTIKSPELVALRQKSQEVIASRQQSPEVRAQRSRNQKLQGPKHNFKYRTPNDPPSYQVKTETSQVSVDKNTKKSAKINKNQTQKLQLDGRTPGQYISSFVQPDGTTQPKTAEMTLVNQLLKYSERKADMHRIDNLFKDAERKMRKRMIQAEEKAQKLQEDDEKDCTFIPTITQKSRQIANHNRIEIIDANEEGQKITKDQVDHFYARQIRHKKQIENKMNYQRQEKLEKELEEFNFMPELVSREIKGIDKQIYSFNKNCNARPKNELQFGNSYYPRSASRNLALKKSPSPETKQQKAKLQNKNNVAVNKFVERQRQAKQVKDQKKDIIDPLSNRHKYVAQSAQESNRGYKSSRGTTSQMEEKSLTVTQTTKNTTKSVPKKKKKTLKESIIKIGQRKQKSKAQKKVEGRTETPDRGILTQRGLISYQSNREFLPVLEDAYQSNFAHQRNSMQPTQAPHNDSNRISRGKSAKYFNEMSKTYQQKQNPKAVEFKEHSPSEWQNSLRQSHNDNLKKAPVQSNQQNELMNRITKSFKSKLKGAFKSKKKQPQIEENMPFTIQIPFLQEASLKEMIQKEMQVVDTPNWVNETEHPAPNYNDHFDQPINIIQNQTNFGKVQIENYVDTQDDEEEQVQEYEEYVGSQKKKRVSITLPDKPNTQKTVFDTINQLKQILNQLPEEESEQAIQALNLKIDVINDQIENKKNQTVRLNDVLTKTPMQDKMVVLDQSNDKKHQYQKSTDIIKKQLQDRKSTLGLNYLEDMDQILKNIMMTPQAQGLRESVNTSEQNMQISRKKTIESENDDERRSLAKFHELFEDAELENQFKGMFAPLQQTVVENTLETDDQKASMQMAHSHKPSAETMKIMKETPKSYVDNSEQSLFIKADISLIENDDENELIFEKPKTPIMVKKN